MVKELSFEFALEIVKLHRRLFKRKDVFSLSLQLMRSATSVGAMVREANYAESKADFIHKLSIALKEANESLYWIELLYKSEIIEALEFKNYRSQNLSIIRILTKIIMSTKKNLNQKKLKASKA